MSTRRGSAGDGGAAPQEAGERRPSSAGPFDRVVDQETQRSYTLQEFEQLTLGERVRLVLRSQLRFYAGAEEVDRRDAMRALMGGQPLRPPGGASRD